MLDAEEVANLPTDLNVGEHMHAVMGSPRTHNVDPLSTDLGSMENAAVVSHEPDRRLKHSARNRRAPTWMGDFLLGKDIDNTLLPLGKGGV